MSLLTVVDGPADTRPDPSVITRDELTAVWPEVSRRLTKLLVSRGAAADVADDVVQEVAARVLDKGVVFDDAMDLMRWAVPVALNLLVDNARASARLTAVTDDVDQPVADVADLVAHRDRLGRVLRALPLLSAADRAALTTPGEVPADRKEAVRLAVRRHRARRRLLALVDGVAAFAALLAGWTRRAGRAGTATLAVAMTPVAMLLLPHGTPGTEWTPGAVPDAAVEVSRPVRPASVTRPAPRPAERARVAAGATRPSRSRSVAPPPPAGRRLVEAGPKDRRITVDQRRPTEDDALLCVREMAVLRDICVLDDDVVRFDP